MKHWLLVVLAGSQFLISAQYANAETAPVEELLTLAQRKFTAFSSDSERKAFETFFQNIQEGKKADFSPDLTTVSDPLDAKILREPVYADLWDNSRVVQAEWLNWLCTDPAASKTITSKGVEINEARIIGKVDLSWLKLEFPIRTFKCALTDEINLDRASIRGLQLEGTYIKNLRGDGLNVDRDIMLGDNFLSQGEVSLQGASIGGSLNCDGGRFLDPNGMAINLKFCKIGAAALFGEGFRAEGEVSLQGATVGAFVECDGGYFINPTGNALVLEDAKTGAVFLRNGFSAEGTVRLFHATLLGNLECDGGQFINPGGVAVEAEGVEAKAVLLRWGFISKGTVGLIQATLLSNLDCDEGQFINPGGVAIEAEGVKTHNVLMRDGFRAEGSVRLTGATIDGNVVCDNGNFINPKGDAINLELARTGAVLLRSVPYPQTPNQTKRQGQKSRFIAEGTVRLFQATLLGNLECDGGQFVKPGDTAIEAAGVKTQNVFLRDGFRADGTVSLLGASVDGGIACRDGHFINQSRLALNVSLARIQGEVQLWDGFEADGRVDFQEAQIGGAISLGKHLQWHRGAVLNLGSAKAKTLLNPIGGWPPLNSLVLHGFTFEELDNAADLSGLSQTAWIQRQRSDIFRSQPYEQMAKVLREMGLQEEAITVMIAKNVDHGNHLELGLDWLHNFVWYRLVGPCIGFGYQPLKPFYWSLFFIGIGYVLFRAGHRSDLVTPTDKDAYVKRNWYEAQQLSEFYPRFNAFIYSLETFVPLLKLWMSDYWAPNSTRQNRLTIWNQELPISGRGLRVYLWFHVAVGWILTTLWIGGLTGLLKT